MTAEGQPLVGRAIAAEMLSAAPSFQGCVRPESATLTQGNAP